jgi:O-antigen biosynthesis protein
MDINTKEYWNTRFEKDWGLFDGPGQSRFFTRLAIDNLPCWFMDQIKSGHLTFLDWGCAQGDGTKIWTDYIECSKITGIDFSKVAIDKAIQCYPEICFINEDWLQGNEDRIKYWDIVFSSNTLEHFQNLYEVLNTLSLRAKKAIVLVLPYREEDRIKEHLYTFTDDNIPESLPNGFRLIWSKVVDSSKLPGSLWPGEQIVLIYADKQWIDSSVLTIKGCSI